MTSSIKPGDLDELWKLMGKTFGLDGSIDSKLLLSRQLMNLMKKENEDVYYSLMLIYEYQNINL